MTRNRWDKESGVFMGARLAFSFDRDPHLFVKCGLCCDFSFKVSSRAWDRA